MEKIDVKYWLGKTLDGRYEIISLVGEGGMAWVYRATDLRLNRDVAVKIMREDAASDETIRSRFCAESHAVAMLSHPNIVAVYDVSHSDALEYIVMELVDGVTLLQYMERRANCPGTRHCTLLGRLPEHWRMPTAVESSTEISNHITSCCSEMGPSRWQILA